MGVSQVLMATNRIESLDPALIRPGRIDRKIEFPLPDEKTKRRIFQVRFLCSSHCARAPSLESSHHSDCRSTPLA